MPELDKTIPVPCGKCPACYSRRISGWSFRLMQEYRRSISAQFITLTYDTDHVPITRNGYMSLQKRDVQLFFKRLRKNPLCNTVRYYCAGEYGTKTMRPHYHIILFNAPIQYVSKAWNNGEIHYGEVNEASVGYTLKYMSKQAKIPMHRNDDRVPEFSLMSKGIGANYLTDAMLEWHEADIYHRVYCNLVDGKKIAMPRYYKNKIYTKEQREHIGHKFQAEAEKIQSEYEKKMYELHGHNWKSIEIQHHQSLIKKMHNEAEKNRII